MHCVGSSTQECTCELSESWSQVTVIFQWMYKCRQEKKALKCHAGGTEKKRKKTTICSALNSIRILLQVNTIIRCSTNMGNSNKESCVHFLWSALSRQGHLTCRITKGLPPRENNWTLIYSLFLLKTPNWNPSASSGRDTTVCIELHNPVAPSSLIRMVWEFLQQNNINNHIKIMIHIYIPFLPEVSC